MESDLDPSEWAALSALLDEVLKLPIDERPAWLDALRARNPGQHASLLRLLAADAGASDAAFLDGPAAIRAIESESDDGGETEETGDVSAVSGRQIGPYRLLQKVGEGGMGEVWLAEQTAPVRRQVALKLIKQGMDTKQVIARFEAERQALALMDHPSVAKVFEAGSAPGGMPYFAMEYVRGISITDYCDRNRLSTRERLELFLLLCEGVQHAHQKAIIHRDLKPSNVLVVEQDGRRLPKVIDFGVAKATAQKLTEKTMFTELGVLIGTPEYMSPEQADLTGEDVDTRTDVYSLGVILYELLVGTLPFDSKELRSGGFDGIRRMIREQEPQRPSVRLATLGEASAESAACRRTDTPTLLRLLKGDLDWITMKALEKDRARRYSSPMDLAADLARHLGDEAVQARPPSTAYRARKFVRRHRFGVTAATLAFVAVAGLGVVMAFQAQRVARERDRANTEAAKSKKVSGFLEDLFLSIDPTQARGKEVTVREVLDGGRQKIQKELGSQPEVEIPLLRTLGSVYTNLAAYAPAHELLEEAVRKSREVNGPNARPTLESERALASLLFRQGRFEEARVMQEELLGRTRAALGNDEPETLHQMNNLGIIDFNLFRNEEAEAVLKEAVGRRQRVLGVDDPDTLRAMNNLAHAYRNLHRYQEAETLCRKTIEAQKRVLGPADPATLFSMDNLAAILWYTGRNAESEQLNREVYEIRRRILGEEHNVTLEALEGVALAVDSQGRHEEARILMADLVEKRKRSLGPENQVTLTSLGNLASVTAHVGRFGEAENLARDMLETSRRALGDGSSMVNFALCDLASFAALRGRKREALDYLRQVGAAGDFLAGLADDNDFTSLHGDPEFERMIAAAKTEAGSSAQHK